MPSPTSLEATAPKQRENGSANTTTAPRPTNSTEIAEVEIPNENSLGSQSTPNGNRRSTSWRSQNNGQTPKAKDRGSSPDPTADLDPLSRQIYLRTNSIAEPSTSITLTQRILNQSGLENPNQETSQNQRPELSNTVDATKEWRKGSSFLSRLSMRKPWTKDEDVLDSDSEFGEQRDEGSNARALTTVIGAGGGYIPFHKEPPRYIRVGRRNKRAREFNRLFLAQELSIKKPDGQNNKDNNKGATAREPVTAIGTKLLKGNSAIWAAEFSLDGKYLAVAGQDGVVRIFSVISTPEERKAHEADEKGGDGNGEMLSAPVFREKPIREYDGHTQQVLALSWSKNGFLLSCSMDKTVKLWHPSRGDCLCEFKHADLVTSIAFHPTDDRFFLAGSLDAQLRLWSIPDKAVAFTTTTNAFQTAVAFSPDGKTAICGLLSGMCMFFETDGLKPQFQIHVRSSRGKNAKGSKITGIDTWTAKEGPEKGDTKVLITSNDSRIRIYSLKTRMLESKFRGHVCQTSQINARFSPDAKYIICGSEDQKAYIWGPSTGDAENRDKQPYEYFDAHPEVVTVALMAPAKSKQLLSASGDPIYDLCNPPPVTLVSLEESQAAVSSDGGDGNSTTYTGTTRPTSTAPPKSQAWIDRSNHDDGNIVITADRTGTIKIFRQDCAFFKRQQNIWETGSKFSAKVASGVARSASIRTRASGGSRAHSRRGSLSLGSSSIIQPTTTTSSDRIMSWRQDIDRGSIRASRTTTPSRSERSVSPHHHHHHHHHHHNNNNKVYRTPMNTSTSNLSMAAEARMEPYMSTWGNSIPDSPASSTHTGGGGGRTSARLSKMRSVDFSRRGGPSIPPTPSFSFLSAAAAAHRESDGASHSREGNFWTLSRWRGGGGGGSQGAKSIPRSTADDGHDVSQSTGSHAATLNDDGTVDESTESNIPAGSTSGNRSMTEKI